MSEIRFTQKVTKTTSNGIVYSRLAITKFLEDMGLQPGDEVLVTINLDEEKIVITKG